MRNMIMMGGYEAHPSFKMYGIKVADAPEEPFEATVKVQITRQDNPVEGEPCVEFTVLDLQSDAIEIEKAEGYDREDVGDSLEDAMDHAAKKKSDEYDEGEED
jgi:hypothetical protein